MKLSWMKPLLVVRIKTDMPIRRSRTVRVEVSKIKFLYSVCYNVAET